MTLKCIFYRALVWKLNWFIYTFGSNLLWYSHNPHTTNLTFNFLYFLNIFQLNYQHFVSAPNNQSHIISSSLRLMIFVKEADIFQKWKSERECSVTPYSWYFQSKSITIKTAQKLYLFNFSITNRVSLLLSTLKLNLIS